MGPMRLVVDGNNFIMSDLPAAVAGIGEAAMCRLLARSTYAQKVGDVIVVMDGGPNPLRVTSSPVDSVELRLAGHGREADDVIIDLIDACSSPKRLTVVSTDRKVRAAARRRRCRSVTSEQFGHELARLVGRLNRGKPIQAPPADAPAKPTGNLTEDDVAHWLNEFGIDDE